MNLQSLNFNELRVFIRVFEHKSMTAAARELHLTQSGVSQHIKNLEDSMEISLFDRVQRKLIPTSAAKDLYDSCRKSMSELQSALDRIKGDEKQLRGRFRIAAPYEFGKNILGPALGIFLKKHPHLKLHLELGFSSDFLAPLLKGDIDAAVVDAFATHPSLSTQKIYEETLELCFPADFKTPAPAVSEKSKREFLLSQRYVDYDLKAPLIDRWLRHHCGKIQGSPQLYATSGQSQILASWVIAGLGGAVLPHHFLQGENAPKLKAFSVKKNPLKNSLYIATLKGRDPLVLKAFLNEFKS